MRFVGFAALQWGYVLCLVWAETSDFREGAHSSLTGGAALEPAAASPHPHHLAYPPARTRPRDRKGTDDGNVSNTSFFIYFICVCYVMF